MNEPSLHNEILHILGEAAGKVAVMLDKHERKNPPSITKNKFDIEQDSYRREELIYYGPHPCPRCKKGEVVMAKNFYGEEVILNWIPGQSCYPNAVWHRHICGVGMADVIKDFDVLPPQKKGKHLDR